MPSSYSILHRKVGNPMRIRVGVIVGLALLASTPGLAQAQATLGPVLAYHDDAEAIGIGAALGVPLAEVAPGVGILGDFIWFFPDGGDYFELNGNLTYDFPLENSTVVPFVLGGLNVARFSPDAFDGFTELGLNLGAGVKFDAGTLRPSVGLKVELEGGEGFVIFGTLPFALGGA